MIEDTILEKIQKDNIKPKSKWHFLFKEYSIWFLFVFALLIGSIAISIIFFAIAHNDWDIYKYASQNLLAFVFATMPYFWIVLMIIFVVFAYFNFKNTKHGYRYKFNIVIISSILLSIILGLFFYKIGFSKIIEHAFVDNVPIYQNMFCENLSIWHKPENGIVVGEIKRVDFGKLELIDINNKSWIVFYDASLLGRETISPNNKVKIIGNIIENNNFFAKEIRESHCGCGHKNCNCSMNERNSSNNRNTSCKAN